jgi:hypothetical protein
VREIRIGEAQRHVKEIVLAEEESEVRSQKLGDGLGDTFLPP